MIFYAITKFVVYTVWCWLGLRFLAPNQVSFIRALKFGAVRWLIGLGLGLLVAIALGSISADAVGSLYLSIYTPLRVFEWFVLAALILRSTPSATAPWRNPRVWLWVAGGIVVSFASDFASPEGLAGKFCVGRCLC